MSDGAARKIAAPKAAPIRPPRIARTRLSVRTCRTIRRRPAPSAERIANSRERAGGAREQEVGDVGAAHEEHEADNARSRIAVSLSSRPMTRSRKRARPWHVSLIRSLASPARARRRPPAMSARAASRVTPGFSRPIDLQVMWIALSRAAILRSVSSVHIKLGPCARRAGKLEPKVRRHDADDGERVVHRIEWHDPRASGSAPNRRRQNPSLKTTTSGAGTFVVIPKGATGDRRHTQHIEEACGDRLAREPVPRRRHRRRSEPAPADDGRDCREAVRPLGPVDEIDRVDGPSLADPANNSDNSDETIGSGNGSGTHQAWRRQARTSRCWRRSRARA